MHKLLARQLKRATRNSPGGPVDFERLFELISAAYAEADKERQLTQRAIGLVSDELLELNRRLTAEAQERLRESEAQFRAVVDHSPTKIRIKDVSGRYILLNKTAEKLFGVSDEEARGKTTRELFPSGVMSDFLAHDTEVLESGQIVEQEEQWQQDDGTHTYLTVKFPIRDPAGNITAIGAIGTDITERKRTEEELTISKDQAELANRTKSEFRANMSHELRTPLNAIIGFSDVIRNEMHGDVGSSRYVEYANDINQSGTHLLDLINDILDLSKIEAGKVDLVEEVIDVPSAIDTCLTLVNERAEQGQVELKLNLADDLVPLYADERRLKQILLNLLSNAIKFTPAGGEVKLSAWVSPDAGYVFQVADTGIGIALKDIPTALAPFKQLDSALNRRFDGAGLGLPLTKSLVEMHGGSLDLQSTQGAGTTVTARFPAERLVRGAIQRAQSLRG